MFTTMLFAVPSREVAMLFANSEPGMLGGGVDWAGF
jgi:hypothetical protein